MIQKTTGMHDCMMSCVMTLMTLDQAAVQNRFYRQHNGSKAKHRLFRPALFLQLT